MNEMLHQIIKPENLIWIIIVLLFLIGKCGFKLDYISVTDIFRNHLKCFRSKKGKLLIMPILNYMLLPFLLGIATTMSKTIDDSTINIITIIVSILTAMLFTMLTMVIDMKAKIKQDSEYFSMEAEISQNSLVETYYTIMFEILISILLLVVCFFNCFTKKYGNVQSFIIYSLTYMLIINLLMIIKRIFRVIDTDMKK